MRIGGQRVLQVNISRFVRTVILTCSAPYFCLSAKASGAGGVAAALAMLNSCAEGVSVVNIDNGFGAAVVACRLLRRLKA